MRHNLNDTVEIVLENYLACAYWADSEEAWEETYEFSEEAQEQAREDVISFLREMGDIITDPPYDPGYRTVNWVWLSLGHDFWLTRNGHGSGFWDRTKIYGNDTALKLNDLAATYNGLNLYLENNLVHMDPA